MSSSRIAPSSPRPSLVRFASFGATVCRVVSLGGNFARITLASDELADFHAAGLDQRVKLVFPLEGAGLSTFPRERDDWYAAWRELDDCDRCPMRTYTVRAARGREIDIDFALHGDSGPATRWANRAEVGQEIVIIGPDARTLVAGDAPVAGVEFRPGAARRILLAGDETAAPAICSILESLPPDSVGQAFVEVASAADILPTDAPVGMTVTWLPRDTRHGGAHGEALGRSVRAWVSEMVAPAGVAGSVPDVDAAILWEIPQTDAGQRELYAWIAGEAGCITELRRFLVREAGLHRDDVAFMGYWRAGHSEN